jgi:hypothetical protein
VWVFCKVWKHVVISCLALFLLVIPHRSIHAQKGNNTLAVLPNTYDLEPQYTERMAVDNSHVMVFISRIKNPTCPRQFINPPFEITHILTLTAVEKALLIKSNPRQELKGVITRIQRGETATSDMKFAWTVMPVSLGFHSFNIEIEILQNKCLIHHDHKQVPVTTVNDWGMDVRVDTLVRSGVFVLGTIFGGGKLIDLAKALELAEVLRVVVNRRRERQYTHRDTTQAVGIELMNLQAHKNRTKQLQGAKMTNPRTPDKPRQ